MIEIYWIVFKKKIYRYKFDAIMDIVNNNSANSSVYNTYCYFDLKNVFEEIMEEFKEGTFDFLKKYIGEIFGFINEIKNLRDLEKSKELDINEQFYYFLKYLSAVEKHFITLHAIMYLYNVEHSAFKKMNFVQFIEQHVEEYKTIFYYNNQQKLDIKDFVDYGEKIIRLNDFINNYFTDKEQKEILANISNVVYPNPGNEKEKKIFIHNISLYNMVLCRDKDYILEKIRKSDNKILKELLEIEEQKIQSNHYKRYINEGFESDIEEKINNIIIGFLFYLTKDRKLCDIVLRENVLEEDKKYDYILLYILLETLKKPIENINKDYNIKVNNIFDCISDILPINDNTIIKYKKIYFRIRQEKK